MDKEKYITLEMEIMEFETEDVITTSVTDVPNTNGENELPFIPN